MSWNHHSFVNISPTLVIYTSMERSSRVLHHGNPRFFLKSSKFEFWLVTKSWNHLSFVNISLTLVIDTSMEKSSRVLQHGNPRFFLKSSKFEFWLVTMSWNHLSFVNICLTLVIDTSMERSSRVLQHGHIKIGFFFSKKFGTEFLLVFCLTCFLFKFEIKFWLIFDLCQRSEVIHVGLNKHLYDDIGDASSSLPGSTSSLN